MYIIFLVSGAGTYFAMNPKGKFFKWKNKTANYPYIFGVFILIPPQKFLEAIQQYGFEDNYLNFLIQLPQGFNK
jgi:hypothetical protein